MTIESNRVEKELRESEERFRKAIQEAPIPMLLHDEDDHILLVSKGWTQFSGYTHDDLPTVDRWTQAAYGVRSKLAKDYIDKLFEIDETVSNGEWKVTAKDGSTRIWDFYTTPLGRLSKGKRVLLSLALDITDRKKADDELRTLSQAVEQSPVSTIITDASGNIEYVNHHFTKLTGYSKEDVKGKNPRILQGGETPDEVYKALWETILAGEVWRGEMHNRKKDGTHFWELASISAVFDSKGAISHFVGIKEDITELKMSLRALKMVSDVNKAMVQSDSEKALLSAICDICVLTGGYRMAWIGYRENTESNVFIRMASSGFPSRWDAFIDKAKIESESGKPYSVKERLHHGKLAYLEELELDSKNEPILKAALQEGAGSLVGLPLSDKGSFFGVLFLFGPKNPRVSRQEKKLLEELSESLSFGIMNFRANEERRRLLESVLAIARGVSSGSGNDFFNQLTNHLADAVKADACCIVRLDQPETGWARTVSVVVDGNPVDGFDYPLAETPCQKVADDGSYCIEKDALKLYPQDPCLSKWEIESYAGVPVLNAKGQVVGLLNALFRRPMEQPDFVLSTLRIFASRANAEIEAQQAQNRIIQQASLIDKATDAIIVTDLEGRILFWNKSAELAYGWDAEEAVRTLTSAEVYPQPDAFKKAIQTVMERGEWLGELVKKTKSGKNLIVDCRWTLLQAEADQPQSVLAVERDITERKKLESQLLRNQRLESIGTLAGGIAHDLNNVLAPIMMSIEMLSTMVAQKDGKSVLETMRSSVKRGADLVRQVLTFARGVEGERLEINLKHLVKEIQKIAQDTFPKNIRCTFKSEAGLWTVTGDPTQIHQVLMNLCVNARDAMPAGGTLSVDVGNVNMDETYAGMNPDCKAGPYVKIKVKDTGFGIPGESIDKIFEPFFTTKELGKGTGLGLSTSLAIVRSHEGFVEVVSEPGKGSEFIVYFPANKNAKSSDHAPKPSSDLPHGNGQLVMIVDDEEPIRIIVKATLEKYGYRTLTASNGAEAVSIYAENRESVSVVLTDISMPIMDGNALIEALKSINPDIKIIASSGHASRQKTALPAGARVVGFIQKPYTAEAILTTLHSVLNSDDPGSTDSAQSSN